MPCINRTGIAPIDQALLGAHQRVLQRHCVSCAFELGVELPLDHLKVTLKLGRQLCQHQSKARTVNRHHTTRSYTSSAVSVVSVSVALICPSHSCARDCSDHRVCVPARVAAEMLGSTLFRSVERDDTTGNDELTTRSRGARRSLRRGER